MTPDESSSARSFGDGRCCVVGRSVLPAANQRTYDMMYDGHFMRYPARLLFSVIILQLAPAWLSAGPVLLCDPYPVTELQPTNFVIVLDGTTRDVVPERYPDGSSRLNHDLGEIADGVHTVKVKAVNSSVNPQPPLESAWVAISFMKTGSQIVRTKDESEKLQPTRTFKGYLREEH